MTAAVRNESVMDEKIVELLQHLTNKFANTGKVCDMCQWIQYAAFDIIMDMVYLILQDLQYWLTIFLDVFSRPRLSSKWRRHQRIYQITPRHLEYISGCRNIPSHFEIVQHPNYPPSHWSKTNG